MARDTGYDWRGIAMLTQQLGQLFEPSKARLMSQQQDHEMNMLMAKKAWDVQSETLEQQKTEYAALTKTMEEETEKVKILGGQDLVDAGLKDGANPDQSATIYDKLDVKRLSDLQALSVKYADMIANTKANLDNMTGYNTTAILGEKWSDSLLAKPTEKREEVRGKDYKLAHDADKSGTLSWSEQNNAVKDYIRDYYPVPEGGEGMDITIGGETFQALPEAHAFLAGFRHVRGRKGVDATEAAAAQAGKLKTPDQYLNAMYQARNTIQDYEQKGLNAEELYGMQGELPEGFTSADVDNFNMSHKVYQDAYKKYTSAGNKVPKDLIGVAPVSPGMFIEGESWFGTVDDHKQFSQEGLDYDKYIEIQRSDNHIYKDMAFKIVYNWEDIMKTGSDTEKANMLRSFELLKRQYNF